MRISRLSDRRVYVFGGETVRHQGQVVFRLSEQVLLRRCRVEERAYGFPADGDDAYYGECHIQRT